MQVGGDHNGVYPHRRLAAFHLGALAGRQGLRRDKDLQGAPDDGPAGQPDPARDLFLTQPPPLRIRDRGQRVPIFGRDHHPAGPAGPQAPADPAEAHPQPSGRLQYRNARGDLSPSTQGLE